MTEIASGVDTIAARTSAEAHGNSGPFGVTVIIAVFMGPAAGGTSRLGWLRIDIDHLPG